VSRVDLDAVEAAAKAAEEREWELEEHPGNPPFTVLRRGHRRLAAANLFGPGEIEHIASMDPQTTLALVAELRAVREVQDVLHTLPRDRSPLGAALAKWDQFTRPESGAAP
jgi:hypothetical protein